MVYNRTITRFIADDNGVYQWVRREIRLASDKAEHDIVWSMWDGDHGELFLCIHLNREFQFHTKSNELTDAFLACPPDWAQGPSLLRNKRGLPLPPWLRDSCTRLVASVQQTVDASKFPTLVRQFTQQPSCTILLWQIEIFIQNHMFLWNFHDFV